MRQYNYFYLFYEAKICIKSTSINEPDVLYNNTAFKNYNYMHKKFLTFYLLEGKKST